MGQAKLRGSFEERKALANAVKFRDKDTCIICRKNKPNEMSDEHVIPDSLSGYYHIYCVCKTCNSNMGRFIDAPLVNHKLSDLYRWMNKIKGKSGKVPNPFNGVFTRDGSREKFKLIEKENGELDFKQISNEPTLTKINENEYRISCTFDLNTPLKQKKHIIKKFCKRNGFEVDEFKFIESTQALADESFQSSWEIDTKRFKLGLLKIAYEFAVEKIPTYYFDPKAIEISSILNNADVEKLDKIRMGSGLDFQLFEKLEHLFNFERKHNLWLMPLKGKLICFIKLDTLFATAIVLSNRAHIEFEQSIIGINDLDEKRFQCDTIFSYIRKNHNPSYTRFLFYVENLSKLISLKNETYSENFKYVCDLNDEPILFDENGHKLPNTFYKFLDICKCESKLENGKIINYFKFDENQKFFIKGEKTESFYQVIGFETHKKFERI